METIIDFFSVILWIFAGLLIITGFMLLYEKIKNFISEKIVFWKLRKVLKGILWKLKNQPDPPIHDIDRIEKLISDINEMFRLKNFFKIEDDGEE